MEALGRLFNVHPVADDVFLSLKECESITFVGVNAAGETWTLQEARSAAGANAQNLVTITRYIVSATVGAVWQTLTQTNAATVTTTAAQDVVVINVAGPELSDLYTHVKLTSAGAGTVFAIAHELKYPKDPANLTLLTA